MHADDGRRTAERVREFIQRTFLYTRPGFSLSDDTPLFDQGILDSMGVMEVLEHLEQSFGVTIDEADVSEENLGSVGAICRFVLAKQRR